MLADIKCHAYRRRNELGFKYFKVMNERLLQRTTNEYAVEHRIYRRADQQNCTK